ncbi:hypothetical protein [Bradyrhizobium sp. 1(2017)]|uniref:hypothetical protein n=1 Tax=Bradyrhizobium sp. 1(2017) TaxID=1404888 RepID=UPI001FEE80D3|nr:hypothetical protein [Bradyrhizobium sp. 1(2017)]
MDAKRLTVAAAAFACAASMSLSWSEQGRLSLSISSAEARDRIYVGPLYRGGYIADQAGLPWYAVRAYYAGGPWNYRYSGWADYAARNGIGCTPGTLVKGGDGIMYVCQ